MYRNLWRDYQRSFQGLPSAAWWIAFALFVNRCGSMALAFMTLYVTARFELSPTQAGTILTIYGAGGIVSAALGGRLVSQWGALTVLSISLIGSGAAMLAIMSSPSYPWLIAAVVVWSLFAEAARPASASAAAEISPEQDQSRALTLNRLAENLGMTFGPALGGVLAEIDFRLLFAINASTCWLASALVLWLQRAARHREPLHKSDVASRSPLTDRYFITFLLLMIWPAMVLFQLLGTFGLYLTQYGHFTKSGIGIVFSVNTLMIVLMEMPLMHRLRDVHRLKLVAIGSFLMCLGFGILSWGATALWVGLCIVVFSLGEMLCLSPAVTFVSQRGGPASRGKYLGIYTCAMSIAFLLAPQVAMPVYEWNPRAVWRSILALGPVLLISFYILGMASGATPVSQRNKQ